MSGIIIATVVLAIVGILCGVGLVVAGKKFHVDVDEREAKVREVLPGNNCGACGFAGCDAMAAAIAKGEAPVNGCPVGGAPVAAKVAAIMGTTAGGEEEKQVAHVRCAGDCFATKKKANYVGLLDCREAVQSGININNCEFGCIGFGSCVNVCPAQAISLVNGIAAVDPSKCIGCTKCVHECPKSIIEMRPISRTTVVDCVNKDLGPAVMKVCQVGCIACHMCERVCEKDAIHVINNVAQVDYTKCELCHKCVEKCPRKIIHILSDGSISLENIA